MKTYKDYPDYMFKIIEHFEVSTKPFPIKGTWGELTSTRHNINRFFEKIRKAAADDDYARGLYRTVEKIRLSISPGRAAVDVDAVMTAKLDPLYKAMMETLHPGG